ncbi:MAG: TonB-dependent receptor [Sterolibacteriaceae bacterium MAG5]|nr:TonB-dependent receptor [Candidatus Nitricoxidireducens bremensis]
MSSMLALPAAAETGEREEAALEQMVVTATKTQQSLRDVPSAVTVIDRNFIEKSAATTADQLLQGVPGVYAARMDASAPNRIAQTYTRGLPGNGRTLVLADGIPMNVGYDGQVDWSQLATVDIDRIEVVRGAGSALYGNSAMGGVINIISKMPERGEKKRVDVDYGSLNTKRLGAGYSFRDDDTGLILSANRLTSDGYNMWRPDTTIAADRQAKTGTEKTNLSAKLLKEVDGANLLDFHFAYLRDVAKGLYSIPDYNAQDRQQYLSSGRYRHFGEASETTVQVYVRRGIQDADSANSVNRTSPDVVAAGTPANSVISYRGEFKDNTSGINLQSTHALAGNQSLTWGGEYVNSDVTMTNRYPFEPGRSQVTKGDVTRMGAFVQDEIKFGALNLNLAGRYDSWTTSGSFADTKAATTGQGVWSERTERAFSPKAGATYALTKDLVARGSVGKAFNTPDVSQLYGNSQRAGSNHVGNPQLRPEKAFSRDIGLDYYWGKLGHLKSSLYYTTAENFIYSVTTTGQNTAKQNIDEVRAKGVELEGMLRPVDGLTLRAGYTYNNSVVTQSVVSPTLVGKWLTNVPVHQGNLRADISLPGGFSIFAVYNYVGYRFGTDSNASGYKPYATYDLGVSKEFGKDIAARLNVVNATDKKYEGIGYIAPGVTVTAGLTLKF